MDQSKLISKKNFYYICLLVIFVSAFVLRFYRIASVPDAVFIDEAAVGYNAWCIAHYGVDRDLHVMPMYPQNYDGGQSPLYTYCLVLLIKLANGENSLFLTRIPGVIFSMLAVIFGTKTAACVFQNRKITLMTAMLLTICPFFIMHGRIALDCNLMLGCSMAAVYTLCKYIRSGRTRDLVFCGIAFGFVLYSYALAYFVIPIFLAVTALYLLYTRRLTFKNTLLWAFFVCLTALPILLFIFSLLFNLPEFKFLGFTITPTASGRMADVGSGSFWNNIWAIIRSTLTVDDYIFDAVDKFYTMYSLSIPFIVTGIIAAVYDTCVSLVKRVFHYDAVFLFFYLAGLLSLGITISDRIYRANYYFVAYIYFLVRGIVIVYHFLRLYRKRFITVLAIGYTVWFLAFVRYYFLLYSPAETVQYPNVLFYVPATEAVDYVHNRLDPQKIYIDCAGAEIYYNFYYPDSPYEVIESHHEVEEETWIGKNGFGKYYFTIDYLTELLPENAYIVRAENQEFDARINASEYEWHKLEFYKYNLYYSTGKKRAAVV